MLIFEVCLVTDITWLAGWMNMVGDSGVCGAVRRRSRQALHELTESQTIMRLFPVSCIEAAESQ